MIDLRTEFGKRVEQRLREEPVIWLVTVRADGTPVPSPVWFYWDGRSVLVYSQPNAAKVRNIEQNPRVSLHLDHGGAPHGEAGGNVVILTGVARIDRQLPLVNEMPGFTKKYVDSGLVAASGSDLQDLARAFSLAIRITPTSLRGL
ncbi:MAG TPA: TIGR03667 family PPOX class F420-dependent oxidoreductase [Candidatus Dormibacteraeota bacterium]|nr:TIGR03667 family PPOX class F420-dependent oxidoreductase [Candidatus Dormibacteraeota bacterium]